jgi:DNA-binding IclR family transcriptional regulator
MRRNQTDWEILSFFGSMVAALAAPLLDIGSIAWRSDMMGITRYVRILNLFDAERPNWTVADMAEALDTSASTLYRLVREMVAVELLESTVESRYRLGPMFVEFYRRITITDPLIRSGAKFLGPLAAQAGIPSVAILARLYGKEVMCVAEHREPSAHFKTSYELGRPMPLLRGATSRAVLSTLAKRTLVGLLDEQLGADAARKELLISELASLRKLGVCETHGEVDPDLVGISAPLRNASLGINASVSVIIEGRSLTDELRARIYSAVTGIGRMIEGFMAES